MNCRGAWRASSQAGFRENKVAAQFDVSVSFVVKIFERFQAIGGHKSSRFGSAALKAMMFDNQAAGCRFSRFKAATRKARIIPA